ncbi:cyclic nucleotide-binding/CBS domain-containing protein [Luteococcus peritonei]
MDVELREVRDFLAAHEPFATLPDRLLDELPTRLQMRYHRRGTRLMEVGKPNNVLHILRSGACDIVDSSGALVERTEPGGSFGASSLLSRAPSRYDITTIEDSLVLVMGSEVFHHLVEHHEQVRTFYDAQARGRLRQAVAVQSSAQDRSAAWLRTSVDELATREPVTTTSEVSIREAAQLMTRHRISALLVVDDGRLVGIVTDRDLRSKVVAAGVDPERPLSEVMTAEPVQVEPGTQAFEALLEMTTRGVHHLPVVRDGRALGVVTAGDIVRLQQADPVFMVGDIARQQEVSELARIAHRSHGLVGQLLRQDASADDITRLLTTVADALTRRLIGFAEAELGPAPGPWAWITLGSQARRESSVNSDQDHALVMADGLVDDGAAQAWFAALAERVTDGLEQCGYPRCRGEVMAANPAWRKDVRGWRRQFAHWINEPDPDAVMHCQIFFDARTVHGDPGLLAEVRQDVLAATPASKRFLGQLAAQAVERQPPVGFFRGLVLARRGEEHETFDLKANGVHAVIEIARVHALAHGLDQVGTLDRLHTVARLTESQSLEELADAFEFISHVRLAHQAKQLDAGQVPDNLVRADELSSFDKRHLKDAFSLIRTAQEGLAYTYQTHLMS